MFGLGEDIEEDGGLSAAALDLLNVANLPAQQQVNSLPAPPVNLVEVLKQNAVKKVVANPEQYGGPDALVKLMQAQTAQEVFAVLNYKEQKTKPKNDAEASYQQLTKNAKNLAKNRNYITKQLAAYRQERDAMKKTMDELKASWSLRAYRDLAELKSSSKVLDGLIKETEAMLVAMQKEEVKLERLLIKARNSVRKNYLDGAVSRNVKKSRARRALGRVFGAKPVFDPNRFVEEDFAQKMVA
jgi:hypothetical protein